MSCVTGGVVASFEPHSCFMTFGDVDVPPPGVHGFFPVFGLWVVCACLFSPSIFSLRSFFFLLVS